MQWWAFVSQRESTLSKVAFWSKSFSIYMWHSETILLCSSVMVYSLVHCSTFSTKAMRKLLFKLIGVGEEGVAKGNYIGLVLGHYNNLGKNFWVYVHGWSYKFLWSSSFLRRQSNGFDSSRQSPWGLEDWTCVFHWDRSLQRGYLGTATDSALLYPLSSGDPFKRAMGAFTNGVIIGGAAPD